MSAAAETVVLDISSDDDAWGGDDGGSGLVDGGDDGDWLSELLYEVNRGKEDIDERGNDSDDVVVVKEVLANPRLRGCSKASVKCVTNAGDDDDDDDCVVLDGDPDKPVSVQNDEDDDSDDIVVVGETGQVACRDYPHARHLCVKYPFDSTPHESHCDLCHCYVCDSLAPCLHWSIAISSTDHCHATEKDEFWKNQRKSVKKGSLPLPTVPAIPPSFSNVQSPPYQIPPSLPFDNGQKYYIPNTTPCAMTQQKFQPQLVSQQLQNTIKNVSRTHIGVNAGSHVISRTPVRRARISGVPPTNLVHGQFYNTSRVHNNFQVATPPEVVRARWRSVGTQAASFEEANIDGAAANLRPAISAQQSNLVTTENFVPRVQMISRARRDGVYRNKYVQPRVPAYVPQPQVSTHVLQPQVMAYVPQPQVQAYVPQPTVPTYGPQPQVCAFIPQHQVHASVPQHQVHASVPQHQVHASVSHHQLPASAPQLQMPAGISGIAPLNHMQLSSTDLSNMAGHYGSSVHELNNSSAYQSQAPVNASLQGNATPSPVYSPKDGNVANNGQSSTVPGDLNQSTTGFEINLDYDFSTGHSNQTLPVDQVQKAVQRDKMDSTPDGITELPMYTSPSPPTYQFDPWAFENEPGLDYFGNPAMDVVIDANLFDF